MKNNRKDLVDFVEQEICSVQLKIKEQNLPNSDRSFVILLVASLDNTDASVALRDPTKWQKFILKLMKKVEN